MKHSNITAIILAGGKSRRMGKDKSFVLFSGRALIEIVLNKLSPLFRDLIIVTNNPELYQGYGVRTEPDIMKGRGPLGGIYTGLMSSEDKYSFIAACDMPFLDEGLIQYMIGQRKGHDAVVARYSGRVQPLCAVYSKNCITPIEKELSGNNLRITDFLKHVKVRYIAENEISGFGPARSFFANINTPRDLQVTA